MILTRVRMVFAGLLVAAALLVPVAGADAYSPDDQELAFLDLINAYRAENGLGGLVLQDELGDAADYHSYDMGVNNYFAHTLADGSSAGDNIRAYGYTGAVWGENIAAGMPSAAEAMVNWQNSPGHNAAMLDPDYTEIGVGRHYQEGSAYGWYWTTTFGGGEGNGRRDAGPAEAAAGDGTVAGAPVDGGNAPATVNGVPVESGTVVTTVNGVPVDASGNIVNADGEVVTSIVDASGDAPVDTVTTVTEQPSIATGADAVPAPAPGVTEAPQEVPVETQAAPAEGVYEAPQEAPVEAAPIDEGVYEVAQEVPVEAAPVEDGAYEVAQEAPIESVPAEEGVYEAAQEAPAEAAPVDDGQRRQRSADAAQEVIEPPTINGVPVESGDYVVDGGTVRDASGGPSANADGPNLVYGDIEGGADFNADGGANESASAPPAESAPAAEPAPAPESTTTTTTTPGPNGTGTVTTTTTVNGIQMEDGTSTTYGSAQGDGASASPGEVTYGN